MCSVIWQWNSHDLEVIFNRDEQKARAAAIAPSCLQLENTTVLMPLDPVGGGSWIATNEYGLTVALLNNYAVAPNPDKNYTSRGQLVRKLSAYTTRLDAEAALATLVENTSYAAFSLLIWDRNDATESLYQWNEKDLKCLEIKQSFFTSSSWNTEEVQAYRTESYFAHLKSTEPDMKTFMKTVPDDYEKWSVYMERELTQTVSISQISITENKTHFSYYDRLADQDSELELSLSPLPSL